MQQIALGWLAYDMTGSPFVLGAINGMQAIPFLLLGPWGGVAADRLNKKMLMMVSQGWILVCGVVMAALIVADALEVWHLFAFSALSSIGWIFTMPVRQTLIPSFVPRSDLVNAFALQSAGFNGSRIFGPTLAGLLMASVGAQGAFLAQAGLYVIILVLTAMLNVPPTPVVENRESPMRSMIGGFTYIWSNKVVLWLIILSLIPMLLAFPIQSLMPIFARDVLDIGEVGYGMLVSFMGIGAFTGTMGVASLGSFNRKGMLLLSSAIALGVFILLFSRSTNLPLSLALMVPLGGFQMIYMSLNNSLIHLNIVDDVRGRVMSIFMLCQGLAPIGSVAAGTAAGIVGAPGAVTMLGIICIGFALTAMLQVRNVRELA